MGKLLRGLRRGPSPSANLYSATSSVRRALAALARLRRAPAQKLRRRFRRNKLNAKRIFWAKRRGRAFKRGLARRVVNRYRRRYRS